MAVNGQLYDHEDCNIIMPGGLQMGLTELSYSDGQDIEARYGRGAVPRAYGRKNYEATFSCVMDRDQFERFKLAVTESGGGFYDHKPFNIISSYANRNLPLIKDTLPDCKVTKMDTGYKQGEANDNQVKLEGKILSPIKWNGVAAKKG